jgi:cytochrome oxidase Cu insertion factor (SCO1/SenC/PrrC family)
MGIRPRIHAALLAALLGLVAVAASAAAPDFASLGLQPYAAPKEAPEFSLPDLAGQSHTLAEFKGKVLLLFFWATW